MSFSISPVPLITSASAVPSASVSYTVHVTSSFSVAPHFPLSITTFSSCVSTAKLVLSSLSGCTISSAVSFCSDFSVTPSSSEDSSTTSSGSFSSTVCPASSVCSVFTSDACTTDILLGAIRFTTIIPAPSNATNLFLLIPQSSHYLSQFFM